VRYLVDRHVFLWWMTDPDKLPPAVLSLLPVQAKSGKRKQVFEARLDDGLYDVHIDRAGEPRAALLPPAHGELVLQPGRVAVSSPLGASSRRRDWTPGDFLGAMKSVARKSL
jgi:hypothetical protein